jgi:hypothetical protein
MLIGGVSTLSSGATVLNPAMIARPSARTTALPAVEQAPSANSTTSASSGASAPAKAASGGGSHAHAAAAAPSASSTEEIATSYSTTVGGKQYSGSVEESEGEYTASVTNLARATASGSTALAAEENLYTRIDELV